MYDLHVIFSDRPGELGGIAVCLFLLSIATTQITLFC